LIELLAYVRSHLQKNATMSMNVILSSVAELHQMVNFYIVHLGGNMVIALDVLLTSYSLAFEVCKLKTSKTSSSMLSRDSSEYRADLYLGDLFEQSMQSSIVNT